MQGFYFSHLYLNPGFGYKYKSITNYDFLRQTH